MRISITSGESEGPTKLNAFDNALLDAGIGDVNLIKVSSMLSEDTKIVNLPKLIPGSMTNCVLASITSDAPDDLITAVVAVAMSTEYGCVIEKTGKNEEPEKIKNEAIEMVTYMMNIRNLNIEQLIVEETHHKVNKIGSAIASVVYLD